MEDQQDAGGHQPFPGPGNRDPDAGTHRFEVGSYGLGFFHVDNVWKPGLDVLGLHTARHHEE